MESSTIGGRVFITRQKKSLSKLSLNKLHRKRKCYVMLVVEKTSYDLEKLLMIRYHSECDENNEVKFISLNDIYDFIISYEIYKLSIDKSLRVKLRKWCDEARYYLRNGSTLPHDLLAKIVKLRIITLITNDIYQHKYPRVYHESFMEEDICYLKPRKGSNHKLKKVKFRQLYVILIQFYSPKMIPAFSQTGLSISAIVEFGLPDDNSHKYCFENTFYRQSDMFREDFWKKAPGLYYEHHLDEPIRLVYNPQNFPISKDNPKLYSKQCRHLYKGFLKSIDIESIRKMKDVLVHRFGFHEMLMAQIAKENYYTETENEEIVKLTSYNSLPSISSSNNWELSKPLVKRVCPELDIDSRKRYTKWPVDNY